MATSETLINACCAATILNLSTDTLLQGKCGTHDLTRVRQGTGKRQRVSFILEEVIDFKIDLITSQRNGNSAGRLKLVA